MIVEQYGDEMSRVSEPIEGTAIRLRTMLAHRTSSDDPRVIEFDIPAGAPSSTIILDIPLGDAVAFWQPYGHWGRTTLPPDWRGSALTSVVRSIPLGCLYDHSGRALLGFALSEVAGAVAIRYGVSEEESAFVVCMDVGPTSADRTLALRLAVGDEVGRTISGLSAWVSGGWARPALPAPRAAGLPVYSTWYAHHHDLDAVTLEREADRAADLGFGSVFLDFGWQMHGAGRRFEGCGDWVADPSKFPDFAGFIGRVHAKGLAVVAWVAPFLLGSRSRAFADLREFAPHHDTTLDTFILDPRHARVRTSLVDQLVDLVAANDLDGLKIDFLETVGVYEGSHSWGDIEDVPTAVIALLEALRERLRAVGKGDIIVEHRQPYISPALSPFANVLRAEDCPGDAVLNRTSILDARLSSGQLVHSDMMMWHPDATPLQVARHLDSALFAVPQVSVPLSTISDAHERVLRAWLGRWSALSETALRGELGEVRPHANYPVVSSTASDGSRAVVVAYEPSSVVAVPLADVVTVVNATVANSLVVRLRPGSRWTVRTFDIYDAPMATCEINGEVVVVEVPESGTAEFVRTG